MRFERARFANAYNDLLQQLKDAPEASPRGMKTRELLGVQLVVHEPTQRLALGEGRKFSLAFALAEWLWIMGGRNDLAFLTPYNKRYAEFSDDGKSLYGAYGARVQLGRIVHKLANQPDTRQAVTTIFGNEDMDAPTKDVPCTVSWQFLIRDGRLHMVTTMRSCDAFWGLPYDLFMNTMVQEWVALRLGVKLGSYYHQAASMHVYERHYKLLETHFQPVHMPPMDSDADYNELVVGESRIRGKTQPAMVTRWAEQMAMILQWHYSPELRRVTRIPEWARGLVDDQYGSPSLLGVR